MKLAEVIPGAAVRFVAFGGEAGGLCDKDGLVTLRRDYQAEAGAELEMAKAGLVKAALVGVHVEALDSVPWDGHIGDSGDILQ